MGKFKNSARKAGGNMGYLRFCIFLVSLAFASLNTWGDDVSFKLNGTVGAAFRAGDRALTFGGPKISLTADRTMVSAAFFPSLIHFEGLTPSLRPSLGFGPEIIYGNVGIIVPFYYVRNRTLPFFGVSYKF